MRNNLEDVLSKRLRHSSDTYGTLTWIMTGPYTITNDGPSMYFFTPGAVDRVVFLPKKLALGGQMYYVSNLASAGGKLITVVDEFGATVAVIQPTTTNIFFSYATGWAFVSTSSGSGAPGAPGVGAGARYNWTTTLGTGDPGSGFIGVVAIAASTQIRISKNTNIPQDISGYLSTMDDSTNPTSKGVLSLIGEGAQSNFAIFNITGVGTDNGTFFTFPVTAIASGGVTFQANAPLQVVYTRTGDQGLQGIQGQTGQAGTAGVKGDKGDPGTPGAQGATGPQGTQGVKGDPGAQGPKGDTGNVGPTGPAGSVGPTGPAGSVGPAGPAGVDGAGSGAKYDWDSNTSGTPNAGNIAGNSGITSDTLRINNITNVGQDIKAYLLTLDDSTSSIKGMITLVDINAQTNFLMLQVNSIVDNGSFITATGLNLNHAGVFGTGQKLQAVFSRTGDKGAAGAGTGDMLAANNLSELTNKTQARVNLGVAIGTDVQAQDPQLQALAGLAPAADQMPYFTGLNAASLTGLTAFARTLLDDIDAAAMRTTINAQPLDAELSAIASVSSSADVAPYFTGVGSAATFALTPFARTLLDDTNAAAMQATLGIAIGTNVQAFDTELAALAATVSAANALPYYTGAGTATTTTLTAFARTILDDVDAATALGTLGAQPVDTDLSAIAALSTTAYGRGFLTLANTAALIALIIAGSGGGTANFLRADGAWAAPPNTGGSGDMVGSANLAQGVGGVADTFTALTNLGIYKTVLAGDANYTMLVTDRVIEFHQPLTANRTLTLPVISSVHSGQPVTVWAYLTGAFTITIATSGGNSIMAAGGAVGTTLAFSGTAVAVTFIADLLDNTWVVVGGSATVAGGTGRVLGTAAYENIGTVGHVVPMLDAANTWTGGTQLYKASVNFLPQLQLQNEAADATNPYIIFTKTRGAGVPSQVGDAGGTILFQGNDANGTVQNSFSMSTTITSVAAGITRASFGMGPIQLGNMFQLKDTGQVALVANIPSTDANTGSLVVVGGAGVSGKLSVGQLGIAIVGSDSGVDLGVGTTMKRMASDGRLELTSQSNVVHTPGHFTADGVTQGAQIIAVSYSHFGPTSGALPAPAGSGSLGWNFSGGSAEVTCFNNFTTFVPTNSFDWRQQITGGTSTRLMEVGSNGLKVGNRLSVGYTALNPAPTKLAISVDGSVPQANLYSTFDVMLSSNTDLSTFRIGGSHEVGTTAGASFIGVRTRGIPSAPTATQDSDLLFQMQGQGYDGSGRKAPCILNTLMDGPLNGTFMGGRFVFQTVNRADGATTPKVAIFGDGGVNISGSQVSPGPGVLAVGNARIGTAIAGGFASTNYNGGALTAGQSYSPDPANGNYQYVANNSTSGSITINAPTVDCAIDLFVYNGAFTTGSVIMSGYTVPAGEPLPGSGANNWSIISIRRLGTQSTFTVKKMNY